MLAGFEIGSHLVPLEVPREELQGAPRETSVLNAFQAIVDTEGEWEDTPATGTLRIGPG